MSIVSTIGEKCKKCYACIKSCPAHAIKVKDGKASVISFRCISCGHCTTVCSQNAKVVLSYFNELKNDISSKEIDAIVAPSFTVSFLDVGEKFVSVLKALGFKNVYEVGFGADLVTLAYKKFLNENKDKTVIATPCPAIVKYVQKYEPEMISLLAPIVSPMVACARVAKQINPSRKVAFIGPCIAKIDEKSNYSRDLDYSITFEELKLWIVENKIDIEKLKDVDFDPPKAGLGAIYPVTGGLLRCADKTEDVIDNKMIVTEGKDRVLMVLDSIKKGALKGKFIDMLFCLGCIDGPKICSELNYFEKKSKMAEYVKKRASQSSKEEWEQNIEKYKNIDLSVRFDSEEVSDIKEADAAEIKKILIQMGKTQPKDELNCGACGYPSCRAKARAIIAGLAEKEMCLPYVIEKLEENINLLEQSNSMLKSTQNELIQKEKLVSLGQMAAGVAHEINNPLGTVLLYAHMLNEQIENEDMKSDVKTIITEINRTKEIITGMLNFSRENKLTISEFDFSKFIRDICEKIQHDYSTLGINIVIKVDCPDNISIDADQTALAQVFSNLLSNAKDAIMEAKRDIGKIKVDVIKYDEELSILFTDNGTGIPKDKIPKLFTPFFTTKGYGKGTGLGLPVVYGIIKMHRGKIMVDSIEGESTTFKINLPLKSNVSAGLLG